MKMRAALEPSPGLVDPSVQMVASWVDRGREAPQSFVVSRTGRGAPWQGYVELPLAEEEGLVACPGRAAVFGEIVMLAERSVVIAAARSGSGEGGVEWGEGSSGL